MLMTEKLSANQQYNTPVCLGQSHSRCILKILTYFILMKDKSRLLFCALAGMLFHAQRRQLTNS